MFNKTDEYASKFLGKKVDGSDVYNPSYLVAVPRYENRKQYNINNKDLPFEGCDVWHAYEFSSMTNNGLPFTRLLKLKYSCQSEFIVESKSLKLYLNSFNMSRFGSSIEDGLLICKEIIKKDLSTLLKTDTELCFLSNDVKRNFIFSEFDNILDYVNESELNIERFKEAPELLEVEQLQQYSKYFLSFDSLRSNCRVTHQPDFGDVFVYYKSQKHIKEDSLVKYLCSFRSEYHFHEECCEMIFKRLYDILNATNDELLVAILYTRRGGIDICPIRWSKNCSILQTATPLTDTAKYVRNSIKQ